VGRSTGSTIAFAVPNGTYSYSVGGLPGWHLTSIPRSGQLTVDGTQIVENGAWTATSYVVSYAETGLPTDTRWWANLTNGLSVNGTGRMVFSAEPNGTYSYTIETADKTYSAPGGSFTINNSSMAESIVFSRVTYSVTFTESGLPSGTNWSVGFAGARLYSDGGNSILPNVANGTYSFTVESVQNYFANISTAAITVQGSPLTIHILFTLTPCPCGPPSFPNHSGIQTWVWIVLVAVIAATGVAVGVYFFRYRHGRDHGS